MKRIIFSLAVIGALAVVVGFGATSAFLSDTETASGNVFVAGAIDLKVDNESYYNGAISDITTFGPSDLGNGLLLINFTDLKPDDEGEDTISLHVNNNDAYLCLDMSLTTNNDISSTEPELIVDAPEDVNDTWDGELGNLVKMVWWVDDGDNVLEQGETLLSDGEQTILSLFGEDKKFSAVLADANTNVWTGVPGPALGGETYYIAKGWCYGTMTLNPVTPGDYDSPLGAQGSGFTCNGTQLGNESQTDGVTMDIAFRAVQARHNPNYTCDGKPRLATITVTKEIVNDNGGNNVVGDYQLFVDNYMTPFPVTSGVPVQVPPGNYVVTETGIMGYVASFSGPDCDQFGQVTLNAGDNKSCTIVNNDLPGNITLIKNVINDNGGTAGPTMFGLNIDGNLVQNNTSVAVNSNIPHTINEVGRVGYTFVSIIGNIKCPAVLGGTATLDEGEAIICTITNDDNPLP
jgi:predicted ribosomally synthesized peptide with SipW-like signal peptide